MGFMPPFDFFQLGLLSHPKTPISLHNCSFLYAPLNILLPGKMYFF